LLAGFAVALVLTLTASAVPTPIFSQNTAAAAGGVAEIPISEQAMLRMKNLKSCCPKSPKPPHQLLMTSTLHWSVVKNWTTSD